MSSRYERDDEWQIRGYSKANQFTVTAGMTVSPSLIRRSIDLKDKKLVHGMR